MKDRNGKILEVGQKVVCVEPIEGFLENKVYVVQGILEDSGRIIINPDGRGKEGHYKASRFIIETTHSNS